VADAIDQWILGVDRALKTLTGGVVANRPNPSQATPENNLSPAEKSHAAALMRVNHTGEICAQALYEGQALTADSDTARKTLRDAAQEERDHLAWCAERLQELDARGSVFDPLFYGASFVMGALTGLAGDRVSLGFVEATEEQVVAHLDRHMQALPTADHKSRDIIKQMRRDEARHAEQAMAQGGEPLGTPAKGLMAMVSKVMTETAYRI
jgi:3-demethoxyubiquinol 3-hydroxylase